MAWHKDPPKPSHGGPSRSAPPQPRDRPVPLHPQLGGAAAVPKLGQLCRPVPWGGSRGLRARRGRARTRGRLAQGTPAGLAFKPPPRHPGVPTPGPVPRIRRHRAALSPLPPRARRWHPCPCPCPPSVASCLSGSRGAAQPGRVLLSPCPASPGWARPSSSPPPCPPVPSVAELPARTSPGLVPAARGVTVTVTVTATGRRGATSAAAVPQSPARAVTRRLPPAPPPAPCHPRCHLNCHVRPVTHNPPRTVTCTITRVLSPAPVTHLVTHTATPHRRRHLVTCTATCICHPPRTSPTCHLYSVTRTATQTP